MGQSFYTRLAHAQTRAGLLSGFANTLLVVGADGCARLFDVDASLGLGQQAGRALRTREPYKFHKKHHLRRTIHSQLKYGSSPVQAVVDTGRGGAGAGTGGGGEDSEQKKLQVSVRVI